MSSQQDAGRRHLAVAMIVRDEASVLAETIESVRDIADDLFVLDLSTQEVIRLTDTSQYSVFGADEPNGISLHNPVWSPDGNHLAFVWRTDGKDYIVAASTDGLQLSRITGPGQYDLLIWGQ